MKKEKKRKEYAALSVKKWSACCPIHMKRTHETVCKVLSHYLEAVYL